jgi:hypothetical protein
MESRLLMMLAMIFRLRVVSWIRRHKMGKILKQIGLAVSVVALILGLLPQSVTRAAVEECTLTMSTTVVHPGIEAQLDFQLTNVTGSPIRWIEISRPNFDYTIASSSVQGGWSMGTTQNGVEIYGEELHQGQSLQILLAVEANAWQSEAANWVARVTDTGNGSNSVACGGSATTLIEPVFPPGQAGQGISAVSVDTTLVSAIVRWQSAAPTSSAVSYGETSGYGKNSSYDASMVLNHQVLIGGLKSGTTYHFRVAGSDADGNTVFSGDNTFVTQSVQSNVAQSPVTIVIGGSGTTVTPTETVPPTITLTTALNKPFTTPPVLIGEARDNVAVARVEYSLDGGVSWIEVAGLNGLGTPRVSYRVTPTALEDGDYSLVVRAIDASGNTAVTAKAVLVIDQIPPRLSMANLAYGTQPAPVDSSGNWRTVVGYDASLTLGAVGGSNLVTVEAKQGSGVAGSQAFVLKQDTVSGLWFGEMNFVRAGTYNLTLRMRDGGGNHTTRQLPDIVVTPAASITDTQGKPIKSARATLYVRHPPATDWQVWDGSSYAQTNPKATRAGGSFAWLVPAGSYYVEVKAKGYERLITREITLGQAGAIAPALQLKPEAWLKLGPWRWVLPTVTVADAPATRTKVSAPRASSLVGSRFPAFALPTTTGGQQTQVGLQGKPTLITRLSTWAPTAGEQVSALATLTHRHPEANVVPLYAGEHVGLVATTLKRANYSWPAVVDTRAALASQLDPAPAPTHYLVDRTGRIARVVYGVQSAGQLAELLKGL